MWHRSGRIVMTIIAAAAASRMKTKSRGKMIHLMVHRLARTTMLVPVAACILLAPSGAVVRGVNPAGSPRTSCAGLAYAGHISSCDPAQLDSLSAERDALEYEKARREARLAKIDAQIQADFAAAKPYLDAMCLELEQALDLINQGIAACPNGGNPITVPSFCALPS